MPQQHQNWLAPEDVSNLLHLADYEVVKTKRRLLLPKRIPLLSTVANRLLAFLPGVRSACLCHYLVARPVDMGREARGGEASLLCKHRHSLPERARQCRAGRPPPAIFRQPAGDHFRGRALHRWDAR